MLGVSRVCEKGEEEMVRIYVCVYVCVCVCAPKKKFGLKGKEDVCSVCVRFGTTSRSA